MMKKIIRMLFVLAVCGSACAEQTNRLVKPAFDDGWWNETLITGLVEGADVAGVGIFFNQPTTNDPYVSVLVQDYWGGDSGTNVLRINVSPYQWQTDWSFPTNVPVVFFAINLWECIRIHPDQERFYEVLRDADKLPYEASSRMFEDTGHELNFLLKEFSVHDSDPIGEEIIKQTPPSCDKLFQKFLCQIIPNINPFVKPCHT